ncbi:MAG: hypothetical protein L3K01_05250 [Thermoplasmata archaeon]|nr:hypothetical protein [Thermoplasmata archaeon]MCI4333113.1 hypothetical protein [Thermoplasmata archaeon]
MVYALTVRREARPEFLALPPEVREVYEAGFARMRVQPLSSGPGYSVDQLKPPRGWKQEVWSVHVGNYRAWFVVDGQTVRFGAFGLRPGFYRKLSRLRSRLVD